MIGTGFIYGIAGLMFAAFAILSATDRANPKRFGNASFYAVLAIMSVSGALAWFADLTVAAQVHNVFKVILLALIALHVLAFLYHQLIVKDTLLRRMGWPPCGARTDRSTAQHFL